MCTHADDSHITKLEDQKKVLNDFTASSSTYRNSFEMKEGMMHQTHAVGPVNGIGEA